MLYRRQARKRARILAKMLRASLVWRADGQIRISPEWTISEHEPIDGITDLRRGQFAITIQPSKQLPAVRIFDRCRVSCRGADVWLPLLQRLRTKNAVRLWMAMDALDNI